VESILSSFQEQKALDAAPRTVDPLQQTVATAVQGYLNHPDVDRRRGIELIRFLNQPMRKVQVDDLRRAYSDFQRNGDIGALIEALEEMQARFGGDGPSSRTSETAAPLSRDDLRLICFDFLSGG